MQLYYNSIKNINVCNKIYKVIWINKKVIILHKYSNLVKNTYNKQVNIKLG